MLEGSPEGPRISEELAIHTSGTTLGISGNDERIHS